MIPVGSLVQVRVGAYYGRTGTVQYHRKGKGGKWLNAVDIFSRPMLLGAVRYGDDELIVIDENLAKSKRG